MIRAVHAVAALVIAAGAASATAVLTTGHHDDPAASSTSASTAQQPGTVPPATDPLMPGVTISCTVVPAPSGESYAHSGEGWAAEITITNGGSTEVSGGYQIVVTEFDSTGTQTGYESDYSEVFPVVAPGQSQSFYDTAYDFSGSDPAATPATCEANFG
jgi:hypothetical protein